RAGGNQDALAVARECYLLAVPTAVRGARRRGNFTKGHRFGFRIGFGRHRIVPPFQGLVAVYSPWSRGSRHLAIHGRPSRASWVADLPCPDNPAMPITASESPVQHRTSRTDVQHPASMI